MPENPSIEAHASTQSIETGAFYLDTGLSGRFTIVICDDESQENGIFLFTVRTSNQPGE